MSEETIIRTAVVTGGSRGIGRAVCIQLAKQGCNVVVNYCHGEAAAAETVALCKAENANAVAVQADVSTAEGCKVLFEQAVNAFGRVDILVNNAGITRDNLILRMSEEDFDAVLNANLKGAFLCCKEAARRMVRQRWGRIVNLSSVVALRGNAGQTNYAASKAGVIGMTKSAARELASRLRGILAHVNLIPVNDVTGTGYKKSGIPRQKRFVALLEERGVTATVRRTLGSDIEASCGQLRRKVEGGTGHES